MNGPRLQGDDALTIDSAARTSGARGVTVGRHDPIVTADACGRILTASDSAARLFGWSADDLIGRTLAVIVPECDPVRPSADFAALMRAHGQVVFGRMHRVDGVRRDGRTVPLDVSMTRITLPHGDGPEGDGPDGDGPILVVVLSDISDRVLEERALRLERDLTLAACGADGLHGAFQRLVANFGAATGLDYGEGWMVDEDRTHLVPIVTWSSPEATADVLRRSVDGRTLRSGEGLAGRVLVGGHSILVTGPAELRSLEAWRVGALDAAQCRFGVAAPLRSGAETIGVVLFYSFSRRRDGDEIREFLEQAVEPLGVILDRKRARDRLAAHEIELNEEIGRRTAAIESLERRLHALDRAATIGTLTAGVCHDMQNILLPVRAHLDALLQDEANGTKGSMVEPRRRHVEAIRTCAAYLQQLADGLQFLVSDPTRPSESNEPTHLATWWSEVHAVLGNAVPRSIAIEFDIPEGLPPVSVSASGLSQAALNLLVNAVEAIGAADPPVRGRLRVTASRDAGDMAVRFSVADNGVGMGEKVLRNATDLFFTTKPHGLGTGLGLALVKTIVERAGGRVEIDSRPREGTTVTMVLPTASGRVTPSAATRESARRAAVVIEDSRAAGLVRQLLQGLGARVAEGKPAGNLDDADLIVVDPTPTELARATLWRAAHPLGTLLLHGAPPVRTAAAWRAIGVTVLEKDADIAAMRSILRTAVCER